MPSYQIGDIVFATFIFGDSPGSKLRPCVIYEINTYPNKTMYLVGMITHVNRSNDKLVPGYWLDKDDAAFEESGLKTSSYICYLETRSLPEYALSGIKGRFRYIEAALKYRASISK